MNKTNYFYHYAGKLQEAGYRVVPVKPGDKFPAWAVLSFDGTEYRETWEGLRNWQQIDAINSEIAKDWSESSLGIVTGNVVAIDIDVMDAAAAQMIRSNVVKHLGDTPLIRVGQAPKAIMVYRADKAFGKMKTGKVEALADGQQFVAFGVHPVTQKPYQWIGDGAPDSVPVEELPLVTEEQVAALMTELSEKQILRDGGFVQEKFTKSAELKPLAQGIDPDRLIGSPEAVRSAAMAIPNTRVDWHEWKRMAMLIYTASAGASWGMAVFDEWSHQLSVPNATYTPAMAWDELSRSPVQRSGGANSLYAKASQDHGWTGQWVFPNKPNVDNVAGDMVSRLKAKASTMPITPINDNTADSSKFMPPPAEKLRGQVRLLNKKTSYRHRAELLRGTVPRHGVGFLAGQSGSGKTFIGIELAGCIMTGKDFAGRLVEQQGGVIYHASEGEDTIEDRLNAWRSANNCDEINLPFATLSQFGRLFEEAEYEAYEARLRDTAEQMKLHTGVAPVIVIIDTVSSAGMILPDKEIDQGAWQNIFNHLQAISRRLNVVFVLVHHYGKNAEAGLRGSSNARAGADFALAMTCDRNEITGETKNHLLSLTKHRSAEEGMISSVTHREVVIGSRPDGSPVTSRVIEFTGKVPIKTFRGGRPNETVGPLKEAYHAVMERSGEDWINPASAQAEVVKAVRAIELFEEFRDREQVTQSGDEKRDADAARKRFKRAIETLRYKIYGRGVKKMVWDPSAPVVERLKAA